jgi:serine/threonine-protein kinase
MTDPIYAPGDVIAKRYAIEAFLAAGGMQEVYIAKDSLLPREVALKTPKNDSAAKRFKGSAELSARINHPFIAKTFDYFETDDRAFLIEELISGENLEQFRLRYLSRFDPHLLAQFGHQIAKGLAASHHVGVVHRDLKPNNIIVSNRNGLYEFKITDFGIAKLTEEELDRAHKSQSTIANSSTMFGALPYMSPEVIDSPKAAGTGSDIWALGAILYTLLSGDVPFGQGLKAIPRIMSGKPPDKPAICDQLAQYKWLCNEVWMILSRCLVMDVKNRPTADQLVQQFADLCYSAYPRAEGTILRYQHAEVGAYGFLLSADQEVFFHRDSFYGETVNVGDRVLFSTHQGRPRMRAHPVVPLIKSGGTNP